MNQQEIYPASQAQVIPPRLKAAIATLDLQLDTEIELYQKHKLSLNSLFVPKEQSSSSPQSSLVVINNTNEVLNLQEEKVLEETLTLSDTDNILPSIADEPESSRFWNFLLSPATIFSLFFFLVGTGLVSAILLTEAYKSAKIQPVLNQKAPTPDLARDNPPIEQITLSQPKSAPTTSEPKVESVEPSTTKAPQGGDLTTVLLPPSLRHETQPQAVKLPASMNLDYYYVISKYTGNNSLKKAQSLVKDAYLINLKEGMGIIMAAYERHEDALLFSKGLQKKGVSNFIYHPKTEMTQGKQKQ